VVTASDLGIYPTFIQGFMQFSQQLSNCK